MHTAQGTEVATSAVNVSKCLSSSLAGCYCPGHLQAIAKHAGKAICCKTVLTSVGKGKHHEQCSRQRYNELWGI